MSDPTWICTNSPWHEWGNGLTCRWCDATRTAGEAIVSGLASRRGGTEDAAQALLDAHRTEVRREGARLLEDAACDADWGKTPDFCAGLRAGAELLLAAGEKATADAATATPDALTAAERAFLTFALGLAADRMLDRSDEFTDEDDAALKAFRRMARAGDGRG